MKNAIVFCPYFGRLPNNFQLWLNSAKYNPKFTFVVFTNDERDYNIPDNVIVQRMSFDSFKSKVQNKFDFPINIQDAYKLCDFKVAYGYLFSDLAEGYEYWGHCDLDLIWGDLDKFLPQTQFDKINNAAHLSLYRNVKEINECFMLPTDKVSYRDIFANKNYLAFDEQGSYSINEKFKKAGYSIYEYENDVARITAKRHNLEVGGEYDPKTNKTKDYDSRPAVFTFEEGHVYRYFIDQDQMKKREYAYIHIQKRRMDNQVPDDATKFLMTGHTYEPYQNITIELIREKQINEKYYEYYKIKYKAGVKKLKRIISVKSIKLKKGGK